MPSVSSESFTENSPEQCSTVCPAPGVYPNIPFETYRAWPAMNASSLVEGLQSMRRLRAKLDGLLPDKDTDALRFGRAVHCRLFEPGDYPTRFPTLGKCRKCKNRAKYMTPEGNVCGVHAQDGDYKPPDYVTEDEAERVEQIRLSAFAHPEIQHIRRFKGAEVSLVFDLLGVPCKARLDKLIRDGGGFIIDPKALGDQDFTDEGFSKVIVKRNYHIKAALYCLGVKALLGLSAEFWWIFYQPQPPFDVAAVRMTDFDRQVGTFEVKRLLTDFKRCRDSGEWPGAFPDLVSHVGLPQWKCREYACVELEP